MLLVQRHRVFALAAVAVVLALSVGLGIALQQWRAADRARLAETEQRHAAELARDDAVAPLQEAGRRAHGELRTRAEAMKRLNPQAADVEYDATALGTAGNLVIRSATPVLDLDLTPLTGMPLDCLRRHPTLRHADRSAANTRPEGISRPVAEFWQEWTTTFGAPTMALAALPKEDLATLWLAEIRSALERDDPEAVPLQAKGGDAAAAGTHLSLDLSSNPKLSNLAALTGLPLRYPHLSDTAVRDLTPPRGMPAQRVRYSSRRALPRPRAPGRLSAPGERLVPGRGHRLHAPAPTAVVGRDQR